mmetsp:Transcript_7445/g.23005  ORF Transcript_7445/g.23005 Transcript_7445/m.23005 type:complete len:201 (-) Transcript_7445:955-1557(-)
MHCESSSKMKMLNGLCCPPQRTTGESPIIQHATHYRVRFPSRRGRGLQSINPQACGTSHSNSHGYATVLRLAAIALAILHVGRGDQLCKPVRWRGLDLVGSRHGRRQCGLGLLLHGGQLAHVRSEEAQHLEHRSLCLRHDGEEEVPRMYDICKLAQPHDTARGRHGRLERMRIVKHNLSVAHVDERGRKVGEGVHRRHER